MSPAREHDPIAAWTAVSERAARATRVRAIDGAAAAAIASRGLGAAGLGLATVGVVVLAVALVMRPAAAPPIASASDAVASPVPGSSAPSPAAIPSGSESAPASEPPVASSSLDPTVIIPSDGPVHSSTSDDLFDLQLTASAGVYTPGQPIEPFALIRYRGSAAKVTVGHADPDLVFTIGEVDGDRQMTGGADDSCTLTTFTRETTVGVPFHKSGQIGLGFDEAWFRDPVLQLPPGTWRISAILEVDIPACEAGGTTHRLSTSIVVSVVAAP